MALLRHIFLLILVLCAVLHANAASVPTHHVRSLTTPEEQTYLRFVGLIIYWPSPSQSANHKDR